MGSMITGFASGKFAMSQAKKGIADYKAVGEAATEGYAPYIEAGQYGIRSAQQMMEQPGSFTGSAGYQFRLGEGQRAVERSAAGRGKMFSGQLLKELTTYGQGMASQEYQAEFQRRMSLSQPGLQAVGGRGQIGLGAAQGMFQGRQMRAEAYDQMASSMSSGMGQGMGMGGGGGMFG